MNDRQLVSFAFRIGLYVLSFATTNPNSSKPWINSYAWFASLTNPYYDQTQSCLLLKIEKGVPNKIFTPFGYWTILQTSDSDWSSIIPVLKTELGLVDLGNDIWGITTFGRYALPEPTLDSPKELYGYVEAVTATKDIVSHEIGYWFGWFQPSLNQKIILYCLHHEK